MFWIQGHLQRHKGALSGLRQFLPTASRLKMIENAFYFILKALLLSKYLNFCLSLLFDHVETWPDSKDKITSMIRLISKFMTSRPGKQTISIHILPNISRSKDNQLMKFGQLIEHNMRDIFLEKSYTKYSGKTISRPFSKKLKLDISPNQ